MKMDDEGHYRVSSSRNAYYVSLTPYLDCPCGDFVWRQQICKHLCAALLWAGDKDAVALANQVMQEDFNRDFDQFEEK